jgi:CRISPR/Cas system-associated protein endoribonuclease Cas2
VEDQILTNFIGSFSDDMTIQNWMNETNRKKLCEPVLFKQIISKVKDILSVINEKKYSEMKSLIIETNMKLDNVCHLYFETFNIISSVKRILMINDANNTSKSDKKNAFKFSEKFLYEEFEMINQNLKMTILKAETNSDGTQDSYLYLDWIISDHGRSFESKAITENISLTIDIFKDSNDLFDQILPVNKTTHVSVEAHALGFKHSTMCFDNKNYCLFNDKSVTNYQNIEQNNSIQCLPEQFNLNQINIEDYMCKTFFCNKALAKTIIALFHYYSEIKSINTKYEVFSCGQNDYQIIWSL